MSSPTLLDNKPEEYKLPLACWNRECHPLDEFVADRSKWLAWNEWRGRKNDWTRPFVFSLMQFYLKPDAWLFGGIFEVLERYKDKYTLRAIDEFDKYTGRLLISFHRYQGMRGRAFNLESYLKDFTVAEIFPEVYSGESFPGFENISHDFGTLEAVFRAHSSDWKAALENEKSTGKLFFLPRNVDTIKNRLTNHSSAWPTANADFSR